MRILCQLGCETMSKTLPQRCASLWPSAVTRGFEDSQITPSFARSIMWCAEHEAAVQALLSKLPSESSQRQTTVAELHTVLRKRLAGWVNRAKGSLEQYGPCLVSLACELAGNMLSSCTVGLASAALA